MSSAAVALQCMPLKEAERYWHECVRAARRIALFLDFDGTISPIVTRPELAVLDPQIKQTLEHLRNCNGVDIAVISGRRLSDLKERTGIDGIVYAGNHGLEIETHDLCFREPRAESLRLELKRVVLRLELRLAEISGVLIEQKGLSAAIHYRQVHETMQDWVKQTVFETIANSQVFSGVEGKMVVDIRPKVAWDKGAASKWILARLPNAAAYPIALGDDITDEDTFRAMGNDGLTIHVGEPAEDTAARFWLKDIPAVRAFLRELCDCLCTKPNRSPGNAVTARG